MMSISQSILQTMKMTFYVESNQNFLHLDMDIQFLFLVMTENITSSANDLVLNGKDVEYEIVWHNVRFYKQLKKTRKPPL
jgi:hypothetical protein